MGIDAETYKWDPASTILKKWVWSFKKVWENRIEDVEETDRREENGSSRKETKVYIRV